MGMNHNCRKKKMLFCMSGDQGYRFFAAGFRRGNHLRVFPPAKGMVDPPWGHPDHLRLCSDETLKKKRAVITTALVCFL